MTNPKIPLEAYKLERGGLYAVQVDCVLSPDQRKRVVESLDTLTDKIGIHVLILEKNMTLVPDPNAAPRWSSEPPTEPGFYWTREGPDGLPEVVAVDRCQDGRLQVLFTGDDGWEWVGDVASGTQWSGPLEPPQ